MKKAKNCLVTIMFLVVCITFGSALAAVPTDGLVSHWAFDEGAGLTANDSAGSNHGTIYGARWLDAVFNGGLAFDGIDDYVDCGNDGSLDFGTGDFSIGGWVKDFDSVLNPYLWVKLDGDSGGYRVIKYRGYIKFETMENKIKTETAFSASLIADQNWHHIVAVRNGSTVSLWLDGVLIASDTGPVRNVDNSKDLVLGVSRDKYQRLFAGLMDEVVLFDRALTSEQINQLYAGVVPPPPVDPVLDYVEIVGLEEVAQDSQVKYQAFAYYDDGSTKDVTGMADWMVEPNDFASVEAGVLTTDKINRQYKELVVAAFYTEGEQTVDASKAVTVYAMCGSGNALMFDGFNDYVNLGDIDAFEFGDQDFTISAWINCQGEHGGNTPPSYGNTDWGMIIGKYNWGLNGYTGRQWILAQGPEGQIIFFTNSNGSATSNQNLSSATYGYKYKWVHVAAVRQGDTKMIYINGELDNTGPAAGVATGKDSNVLIGANEVYEYGRWTQYQHFNGNIDEVSVWDRALNQAQIQQLTQVNPAGDDAGLIGYWDFEEAEGSVAYDMSGNGNDGQLVNGPVWIKPGVPTYVCTIGEMVERNMEGVLDIKDEILGLLDKASVDEQATVEMLIEMFRARGRRSGIDMRNMARSVREIRSAMHDEQKAADLVNKSIDKIDGK